MKQFIVMVSTIILGVYIFDLIIGSDQGSLLSVISTIWQNTIEERRLLP